MDDNDLFLPEMLDIPEKLMPVITYINDYRYFLLEGGRGGGKSQSVARLILYLCDKYDLRVVCGREIQNSIQESVYSLMADLIKKYNLYYEVFSTKIVHKLTGSTINFRGFREQGSFNIQGMEGIDITWIDEAQAITKQTLDVLIPTIRKNRARIFFTMNRHINDDPVFENFAHRKDCLHIHIDYHENKHCTEALKNEADECKIKSMDDYNHIWLGYPLEKSEDILFGHDEVWETKQKHHPIRESYGLRIGGFDIARFGDDKCACVVLQQMGALHWETVRVEQWDHKDLNYTTGRILQISNDEKLSKAVIDEDGIGAGPLDTLAKGRGLDYFLGFRNTKLSYADDEFYGNNRSKNAYKLKDMILKGYICITDDDLIKELLTLRYTFDNYQRRILVSKDKMKKNGVKSPNIADALIMAVSVIGQIKYDQEHMYRSVPKYSPEENLFKIGGIR